MKQDVVRRRESAKQREREAHLRLLKMQQCLVRDIHDGLGGIAANLAFTAILARKETDVTKKNNWIEKLERLAAEANTEVRDLMNSLEESTMRWGDLIAAIRRSAEVLFDPQLTTVRFNIADVPADEELGLVEGMSLSQLIREGMNNIVKHAGASVVEININFYGDFVSIDIDDNGCGFDAESVRKGRGLKNFAKRSAELDGVFEISSENGTHLNMVLIRPIRIVVTEAINDEVEQ